MAQLLLQLLLARGFDKTTYDEEEESCHVGCSQCEALVINGTSTHETGCPNQKETHDVS